MSKTKYWIYYDVYSTVTVKFMLIILVLYVNIYKCKL